MRAHLDASCPSSKPRTAVRGGEVQHWAEWDDAGGIDFVVRDVVVAFDVIDIHCLGNARLLLEIQQVPVEMGVINDAPEIAFEMAVVNRIEPHQRAKQTPVSFDDSTSEQVTPLSQSVVEFVESREQNPAGILIDFL